ncbi:MAG: ribosome-associated translation inhibitor RaiA [Candidatus Electryoneaceae bacterium]|nr:ribosome-associated translation inhibitor RaiA [Candidatus Electryoneaceae bacterium]
MQITFSARHFEASDKLEQFARKELLRLEKYYDGVMKVDIILEENGSKKEVEVRLNMLGKLLPTKMDGNDFYKMIPQAIDKIAKQIKATKSKTFSR